jgi:kinesin family protein C1
VLSQRDRNAVEEMYARMREMEAKMREMQAEIDQFEAIRRKMHNSIQDLKGNIRVFCRIRQPLEKYMENGQVCLPVFKQE